MSANAVDNTNLKNYRDDQGTTGFIPAVSYAYDAAAKEIDITDATTYPSTVTLKKVKVHVHDKFGNEKRGVVVPAVGSGADTVTVDVASLDASKGLDIKVTVIASNNLVADGIATNIGDAGSIGSFDVQKNAIIH